MKRIVLALLVGIVCGIAVGWHAHPDAEWDIGKDPRGCIVQWDDGTFTYKARTRIIYIGDLKPGETITIQPFK